MPLSADTLAWIRSKIGDIPPDAEVETVYNRLGSDRVATAREILERRLANFAANPASFSVVGEYSQSVGDNIKALQEVLDGDDLVVGGVTIDTVTIIPAPTPNPR